MKKKLPECAWRYLPPAVVLLLIVAFYMFCTGRARTEFPVLRPADGVLDARSVDFDADIYHILNQWDYYPGRLLMPEDFNDPVTASDKSDPLRINTVLGTWRLRILAQPDTYLSLCSFSIDYCTRVFVNGMEVRNIGFVSDDPAQATPMVRYTTLPLYTGEDGMVEIIYQYANYVNNQGGFIQNTQISTPENIDEYQRGLTLNALVVSGGLIMLFFYFLLCAAFQKNREYAALALCCLVVALRNQFFFAEHLLPSAYDLCLEYRFVVLDVSWIPMSTSFLLTAFYHQTCNKKAIWVFTGLCLILSSLHFLVDTHDLVLLCHVCYWICAPYALLLLLRYLFSFRKQKPVVLDVITLITLLFFVFMLIREGIATGSNSSVNHFGITPLAMLVCILLLAIVNNEKISRQAVQLQEEQQRNEMLSRINATNKNFLRTVAHELKTPLTVISGYAQLIGLQMECGPISEETPEYLKTIQSESDRLAQIVTQLMDYTYGKSRETKMASVDIAELFHSAAAILTPVCEKRKNTLIFHNGSASKIHGNEELLLQVLINLIVNASRHTEAGQITVDAADTEGFVLITVSDTGKGIPPDAVPHIFEKGYSTDDSRGLGLAICMDTVKLHGGTLELAATSPKGTAFRFTVPKEETL
ncbi:MAG: HAMP domain-containing histidine kinase [Clostridia bacterium]|nr:HAMP domain-containing histidine kinase [Clostridia bacterium]